MDEGLWFLQSLIVFLGENEYVIQKIRNSKDTEYTYIFCDTGDNILSSGVVNT